MSFVLNEVLKKYFDDTPEANEEEIVAFMAYRRGRKGLGRLIYPRFH